MLDCTHILEIVPSPTQSTQATVQLNNPPNVWHKNHKSWAHRQESNVIAPKIKIESQMLDCTHILEIVPFPTQGLTGQQTTVQLDNPQIFGTDIRMK